MKNRHRDNLARPPCKIKRGKAEKAPNSGELQHLVESPFFF